MRAGRIGRAGGVDKGQLLCLPQRQEAGERGVQAEMLVERERAVFRSRARNRDCRARRVIGVIAMGHDDIEAIDRAAQ
jgi:hypothetical protein